MGKFEIVIVDVIKCPIVLYYVIYSLENYKAVINKR